MKKILIISLMLSFGLVSGSYATVIDFRSGVFSGAKGKSVFEYPSAGLTISALSNGAKLYQDSQDGLGVNSSEDPTTYEWDEIEGAELLKLHFNIPQVLHEILITDLFYEPYNCGGDSYHEEGKYSFDNMSWTVFIAEEDQTPGTNGEFTLPFPSLPVITDIWFGAPGWMNYEPGLGPREDHEFSVAQIEVNPVPEPATMLLLGSGLICLAGFRRKFRKGE